MRLPFLTVLIFLLVNILTDFYLLRYLYSEVRKQIWAKLQLWSALTFALGLIIMVCWPLKATADSAIRTMMWILFVYISIYIPKYVFVVFDAISRLPRLWDKKRWKALSIIGGVISAVSFVAFWWGALFNRFNLDVREVDVTIANLPARFEGFRIAQISDLHVGTYGNDTTFVAELVDKVNRLDADVIVFTGDIVNRHTGELEPFVSTLSRLSAPYGVYSILGNHDYGDYYKWESETDRDANNADMEKLQKRMGWRLLKNGYDILRIENDSIALIGVENVGDPPFRTYGDLADAYPDVDDPVVKIMLSHNPAHWRTDIANSEHNIDLTLSGHTHAMQMTIFGWSPAAFRYHEWGGLYSDTSGRHQLYVNIGTGTVGFPARIGATPEITLITLHRGNDGNE